MSEEENERYAFLVEWYDAPAALVRRYTLLYYLKDNTIEMVDLKNKRPFLKRTKSESVRPNDLYIGSTVFLLSRMLTITDFGDEYTRRKLSSATERTLGIIKPSAVSKAGEIMEMIEKEGLKITSLKMCLLNRYEALAFYREFESEGKPWLQEVVNRMSEGPVIAMELMGTQAISCWRHLIGPSDPADARKTASSSLRARFGKDSLDNAVHGSLDEEHASAEIEFFFPSSGGTRSGTVRRENSTCGVIKPHAVAEGLAGKIIHDIVTAGFDISAMAMFHLDRSNAEEFFEVYRGVVAEFTSMVAEMTAGPCIALEISAPPGEDIHANFREFCGPADPEIGRHLRPRTVRARYGQNKVHNAIHCTDLPEDAPLEVQFFFQILDK